jgi:hypothetical protein
MSINYPWDGRVQEVKKEEKGFFVNPFSYIP